MKLMMPKRNHIFYKSDTEIDPYLSTDYGESFTQFESGLDNILSINRNVFSTDAAARYYFEDGEFHAFPDMAPNMEHWITKTDNYYCFMSIYNNHMIVSVCDDETYEQVDQIQFNVTDEFGIDTGEGEFGTIDYACSFDGGYTGFKYGIDIHLVNIHTGDFKNLSIVNLLTSERFPNSNQVYLNRLTNNSLILVGNGTNNEDVGRGHAHLLRFDGEELEVEFLDEIYSGSGISTIMGFDGESAICIGDSKSIYAYGNGRITTITEEYEGLEDDTFIDAVAHDKNNFAIIRESDKGIYAWY